MFEGQYRILFLNAENGTYEFTSIDWPSVVAVPARPSASADPLDRVYHVLASVLTSPNASSDEKREAMFSLSIRGGNDETKAALQLMLHDPDSLLVANAAAALLNGGNLSVLPIAERLLLQPRPGA